MALAASRLLEIEFKASVGQLPNTQWVIMPSFKLTLGALQPSKKRTWFGGNSFCLSSHELWCNRHKWLVYIHTFEAKLTSTRFFATQKCHQSEKDILNKFMSMLSHL